MKNTLTRVLSFAVLALLMIPGCDWFKKQESAKVSAEDSQLIVLDVNSAEVYQDAHIPFALNSSLDNLEQMSKEWDKKATVVVYCSDYACMASHQAADMLKKFGFEDVVVYPGGIQEWYQLSQENNERYPIEGAAQKEFLKMDVKKVEPEKEAMIMSAEKLAQRLQQKK